MVDKWYRLLIQNKKWSGWIFLGVIAVLISVLSFSLKTEKESATVSQLVVTPSVVVSPTISGEASPVPSESADDIYYTVRRVVDGDTIDVEIDGVSKRIRLIGVNTPESVDPRRPVQCFGKEASKRLSQLLENETVVLESDPSQTDADKYNRLLRYVFLADGTHVNLQLIQEGYAHEYTYDNPYKYQKKFKQAQQDAQRNQLGLWSPTACPTATSTAVPTNSLQSPSPTKQESVVLGATAAPSATPQPVSSSNTSSGDCTIKGNINSQGEKIYHVSGCGSYAKTQIDTDRNERWFCSEAEALAAGWRKANNCP